MNNQDSAPIQENEYGFDIAEFKQVEFIEGVNICDITPNGVTFTLNSVHDWVMESIKYINDLLDLKELKNNDSVKAFVWAYRYDNGKTQYIALDLSNEENKKFLSFNFAVGGEHSYKLKEPTVPDCVEAIHMIGLITSALNIKAEIGSSNRETNDYCK